MEFEQARRKAIAFRDERDWAQFHNPKDLAISISLESAELLEAFQWSGADTSVEAKQPHMAEELADVMVYCIYMADALGVDIPQAISDKLDQDARKYPAEKARGNARKYTEL